MTAALLAFGGFCVLIVLHELGHFVAAKAVGMRVERFSLFFPPLLARVRRGETEYAIGAVPLGGYVKISGMTPHEELPPEVAHRAYFRQKVWKRIVVILAGPLVNLVLAFAIFWAYFAVDGVRGPVTREVAEVARDSPAVGVLREGDVLVAVDGRRGDPDQLRARIGRHRCAGPQRDGCKAAEPARLTVLRDGRERTLTVTPEYDAEARRPLVGFGFGFEVVDLSVGEAADESVAMLWFVTRETVSAIGRLVYDSQARKEVSGVVGSYETTRQSFLTDTDLAIRVLGLISLSLAVINLFPFLPLDGGHIFWALAEKVRGRPIPFRVLERVSVVGFLLVACLFVIGLTNDIGRITSGEGFRVR